MQACKWVITGRGCNPIQGPNRPKMQMFLTNKRCKIEMGRTNQKGPKPERK